MPRKKVAGIYQIRNLINGKVYVGSSSCLGGREKEHLYRLKAGNHHSQKLQRAWAKYGEDAFKFEILELIDGDDALLAAEQRWIDQLDCARRGYNVAALAGRTVGVQWSAERREAQSKARRGIPKSPEHARSVAEALIGHAVSDEARRKISEKAKERYKSKEARDKIGAANRGRKRTDEVKKKLSEAQRAAYTPERRAAIAERMLKSRHSDEAKAKIAESNRRRKYSEETLRKMSESAKAVAARKRMAAELSGE